MADGSQLLRPIVDDIGAHAKRMLGRAGDTRPVRIDNEYKRISQDITHFATYLKSLEEEEINPSPADLGVLAKQASEAVHKARDVVESFDLRNSTVRGSQVIYLTLFKALLEAAEQLENKLLRRALTSNRKPIGNLFPHLDKTEDDYDAGWEPRRTRDNGRTRDDDGSSFAAVTL